MVKFQIEDLSVKLRAKLRNTSWGDFFKVLLCSEELNQILTQLQTELEQGFRFTPTLKQIFKPFEICTYSSLKVVIVGGVPYDGIDQSDGLVFSASRQKQLPVALQHILDSVKETQKEPTKEKNLNDLSRWSKQGVLLLPYTFTRRLKQEGKTDKPFKHAEIWKNLMAFILDSLSTRHPDLIWVFIGEHARQYEVFLKEQTPRKCLSYPSSSLQNWDHHDVWNWINQQLHSQGFAPIMW